MQLATSDYDYNSTRPSSTRTSKQKVDFSAFDLPNNGISREVRFSVYHARARTVLPYGCQGDGVEMGTAECTVCREQVWKYLSAVGILFCLCAKS